MLDRRALKSLRRRPTIGGAPPNGRRAHPRPAPKSGWGEGLADEGATAVAAPSRLFPLNQFYRLPTRPLDHRGSGVAEAIGCLQDCHSFVAQLGEPASEVRSAGRDVVIGVTAGAHQRLVSLPHVPGQRHVAEGHGGGGGTECAVGLKRRPCAVGAAGDLAVLLRAWRLATAARHGGGAEVLAVPELGTQRIFLEHVNVVETLGREVALIFDQRVVGPRHVGKAGAAGRFDTFAAGGGYLRSGQTEHATGAGPGVAA